MFLAVSVMMLPVSSQALERLGHLIVSRRVALGYKQRVDFATALQVADRTLSDIEKGVRKASAGTYAMIELQLHWKPGSIAAILDGGEPMDIHPDEPIDQQQPAAEPPRWPIQHYSTETLWEIHTEILSEIRRRIADATPGKHTQGAAWGRLDPGGHWPEDDGQSKNLGEC